MLLMEQCTEQGSAVAPVEHSQVLICHACWWGMISSLWQGENHPGLAHTVKNLLLLGTKHKVGVTIGTSGCIDKVSVLLLK